MNKRMFHLKLKGKETYLADFDCKEDVISSFGLRDDELHGAFILLAWYGGGSYDGSAFVLFERGGHLYEVNGGHCSCHGLEGQWDPEKTTVEAIVHRVENGCLGDNAYYDGGGFGPFLLEVLK